MNNSFSVPRKETEYPEFATNTRALTTTVTCVLYSLLTHSLNTVTAITVICGTGSVNEHQ
jgi:hypothetical protein